MRLFHGTPHAIHESRQPYLLPNPNAGRDAGDPQVAHAFGTPDLDMASLFAFRNQYTRSIFRTISGSVMVYEGVLPSLDAHGWVCV